jgi:predicted outer membrane repeat protein
MSRDACTYFDNINSYSLIEPINRTSGFDQVMCNSCDAFIILTSSDNHCPGEFTGDPCLTLQQYAGSPSSDANIYLLLEPGNHTLTGELMASNSYNYTMSGSDSKVLCDNSAQISLTSIQHVSINGVSFMGCAQNVLSANGDIVELRNVMFSRNQINKVESINHLIVIDSIFDGNSDTGLDLRSIANVVEIENCTFSNNGHRGITAVSSDLEISKTTFYNNIGPAGGCIHAESSTVTIRLTNFTECTSNPGLDGGAIYGQQVAFTITRTNFTDNRAGFGGGAIAGGSSSFNITSSSFIRNVCTQWGGAIKADVGTSLLILADTNFISNTARSGGAVFAYRLDTLICCNFINNAGIPGNGGGLYLQTLMSVTISYCNFLNNTNSGGGFGGAGASIFVESNIDYVSVNIIGSSFVNNTALPGQGGGLLVKSNGQHASIIVTDSSFRNNSANLHDFRPHQTIINGGAIYFTGGNGSIFINNSDLTMNSASISGGAVYVTGSVSVNNSTFSQNRALMGEGGAIVANQQNASVSLTQTIFSQNTAPSCGAISIQNLNHIVTLTDSSFLYNEGTNHTNGGGGVACLNNSVVSAITCNFLNNMANYHGGVFIFQSSSFRIEDSSFQNNFALQDGGAIYSSTRFPNPSTIYMSSFIQNTARRDGGVLFIETSGELLNITWSTFSNNSANNSGGIFYINEGIVDISETNIFNNTADTGDAIRACDSIVMFPDSQFTVSTDSSNCTLYNGNTDNFDFGNFSHTPTNVAFDTSLTTFSAICPFEYDTDPGIVDTTTAPVTATSIPEVTTTTGATPATTATIDTTTAPVTATSTVTPEVTTTTGTRLVTTATETVMTTPLSTGKSSSNYMHYSIWATGSSQ